MPKKDPITSADVATGRRLVRTRPGRGSGSISMDFFIESMNKADWCAVPSLLILRETREERMK
jgi:hypothetical protein